MNHQRTAAEEAQQFESVFLKLADNDACLALEKLLAHDKNWNNRLRSAWARFITSLLFRNPEVISNIRDHILKIWDVGFQSIREDYDPTEHNNIAFDDYIAQTTVPHIDAAEFLRGVIDNDRVGETIFSMHWNVVRLDKSDHFLMTSDRPIDMPWLGGPDAYIGLPIGPRILFVASKQRDFVRRLRGTSDRDIVRQTNRVVVTQAREYVWALSEAQSAFVKRNICTVPDRVILSEEQKRAALEAIPNTA